MPSTTPVTSGGASLPLELLAGALAPGPGPAGAAASKAAAAGKATAAAGAASTSKAAAPKKTATAKKTTTAKKATAKATTAPKTAGYATQLPADYAFLRDPKLPVEEKLSRFIGMLMAKSERDLLAQMERMAPGSTAAAGPTASKTTTAAASTATAAAPKPKTTKFSLWGLAKSLFPPLNLASQLLGETQLKAILTQVSGPVLAAAAAAVGLPQLAPLAQKYGPTLVGALTKEISLDVAALTGGAKATSSTSTTSKATTSASAAQADPATSEKAQLMELQRLQDRDKELFTLFSNMLKAMHDARMTSIQNIR